jgi:hypothetical protein
MYAGSRLCGQIKYTPSAEPGAFGYCHCTSCRKASGVDLRGILTRVLH